jgi:hypothetical protein
LKTARSEISLPQCSFEVTVGLNQIEFGSVWGAFFFFSSLKLTQTKKLIVTFANTHIFFSKLVPHIAFSLLFDFTSAFTLHFFMFTLYIFCFCEYSKKKGGGERGKIQRNGQVFYSLMGRGRVKQMRCDALLGKMEAPANYTLA